MLQFADAVYSSHLEAVRKLALSTHEGVGADNGPMWVVYGTETSDHPGKYVARLFRNKPATAPTDTVLVSESLDELRSLIPPGLTPFVRTERDDANLLETWL